MEILTKQFADRKEAAELIGMRVTEHHFPQVEECVLMVVDEIDELQGHH